MLLVEKNIHILFSYILCLYSRLILFMDVFQKTSSLLSFVFCLNMFHCFLVENVEFSFFAREIIFDSLLFFSFQNIITNNGEIFQGNNGIYKNKEECKILFPIYMVYHIC